MGLVVVTRVSSALAYDPPLAAPPASAATEGAPGSAVAPVVDQAAPPPVAAPPAPPVPTAAPVKAQDPEHSVAITISPFHLFLPVVEIMGEVKLIPKVSGALILGAGSLKVPGTTGIPDSRARAYEAGLQLVFYPLGDFEHGMQLGAEALFVDAKGSVKPTNGSAEIAYGGSGLSTGAFLGYKVISKIGFTFNAQLGAAYTSVIAEASQKTVTVSAAQSGVNVLLNLNAGWAF
jgi:hypothetical protein